MCSEGKAGAWHILFYLSGGMSRKSSEQGQSNEELGRLLLHAASTAVCRVALGQPCLPTLVPGRLRQ